MSVLKIPSYKKKIPNFAQRYINLNVNTLPFNRNRFSKEYKKGRQM